MPPATQAPSESDVLAAWVRAGIAQIHTSFPATIIVYDPVLQKATVQPVVVPRIDDALLGVERPDIPYPPIPNLPVIWPSSSQGSLTFGLVPGDPVTVFIAERSTDEWRTNGGPVNAPLDARRFNLSDGFVYPGGRSFNPASGLNAPLLPTEVDVTGATVLGGKLPVAGVKLGSTAAVSSVILGEVLTTFLTTFTTGLSTSTDPAVVSAAAALAVSLATGTHLSLKVKVDL